MYTVQDKKFETRDEYNRLPFAKRILEIIESGGNSPIFIDGAWGAGKSEFCYKLFHFLKDSNQKDKAEEDPKLIVSYINSFAGDYQSNPFMLIVQAIYNSLITKEASSIEIKRVQGKLSKGVDFAKTFIVAGFRSANLKIAPPLTGVEIEANVGEVIDAAKEGLEKSNEEFKVAFFDELESFRKQSEQLMNFKNAISDAMDGKKIVLIIDELDRCRPDYALELLENIKHIFEIPGLFIIFSANKKQLEAMIHKKYGYGADAEGYLEKFYKQSILLTSVVSVRELDKEYGFVGHLKAFSDALGGLSSSGLRVNFRGFPFLRDLLGTLEARKLESIAENLHSYCTLKKKEVNTFTESHLSVVILGVYLLLVKPEILRGIEKGSVQLELREYIKELPIGDKALQDINRYLDMDLENIDASREDLIYDKKIPSVIADVRDVLSFSAA